MDELMDLLDKHEEKPVGAPPVDKSPLFSPLFAAATAQLGAPATEVASASSSNASAAAGGADSAALSSGALLPLVSTQSQESGSLAEPGSDGGAAGSALVVPTSSAVVAAAASPADASGDAVMSAAEDDEGIDALLELVEKGAPPTSLSDAAAGDVDELLGALAPGSSSPLLAARASPHLSPRQSPLIGALASQDEANDLPDPVDELPPEVRTVPFTMVAKFHLKCEVDLKTVAFGLRHAEYNPRKHSSITIRMLEPRTVALVRQSGSVSITGTTDEHELKLAAKKVARLIQRAGVKDAKFAGYSISTMLCRSSMGFPVRLDALAARWRKHAIYEPELYCGCVFRTAQPRCTYLITAGGKVMISGVRRLADATTALKRIYPVLREFCR